MTYLNFSNEKLNENLGNDLKVVQAKNAIDDLGPKYKPTQPDK